MVTRVKNKELDTAKQKPPHREDPEATRRRENPEGNSAFMHILSKKGRGVGL